MNKKQKDYERIQKIKDNFRNRSTEWLINWRNPGYLGEHGRKAIKEILKERGIEQ